MPISEAAHTVTPFAYADHEVRIVTIDGEPWFVAADVCDYFGVTNRNRALQQIDPEDKGGTQIDTPGGQQTVTTLSESGLWFSGTKDPRCCHTL